MKDKLRAAKSMLINLALLMISTVIFLILPDELYLVRWIFYIFMLILILTTVISMEKFAKKEINIVNGRVYGSKAKGVITDEQSRAELDGCGEKDHIDIAPSDYKTDDEQRLKQLKAMLKNGIISREEYELMIKNTIYDNSNNLQGSEK